MTDELQISTDIYDLGYTAENLANDLLSLSQDIQDADCEVQQLLDAIDTKIDRKVDERVEEKMKNVAELPLTGDAKTALTAIEKIIRAYQGKKIKCQ